jgi:hypothetical protein
VQDDMQLMLSMGFHASALESGIGFLPELELVRFRNWFQE